MGRKPSAAAAAIDHEPLAATMPADLLAAADCGGIHGHALFFDALVQLIPPRFYLPSGDEDRPWYQGLSKAAKAAMKAQSRANVRLVGRMLDKVQHVTDVKFKLDDGTGKIEVIRWESDSSDNKELVDVNDGDYVIVNGGLKSFQGKRAIVAYSVRRVTNFNEITHHFLHCIHVHVEHIRPKAQINPSVATPGHTNQVPFSNNQAATFSASGNSSGKDVFNNLVMNLFNDPSVMHVEHGLQIKDVVDRLKLPEDVVRVAIQYHMDQGNIYNTIDDHHFKSVMNG